MLFDVCIEEFVTGCVEVEKRVRIVDNVIRYLCVRKDA